MLLSLLCALCVGAGVQDPVTVRASLSASRVAVGQATTLQINVETSGDAPDEIRMPVLPPELELAGTSDFSQTQISIPGGRSRLTRREVVLVPQRPGVFRIPPVVVRVRGAVYRTAPLELTVTDAGGPPRSGAPAPAAGPRLSAWLEPDTVYVGEQALLHVEAVFSDEMRLRQTRPPSFDPPAPSGFWIQDMPNPVSVSLRVMDGRTVEIQSYRRAYFPLSPGEFAFPPALLHYEVRRGFLYAPESQQVQSDSARLFVRPLPEEGVPDGFRGAVGELTLRASLAPARITIGDAATLIVEVAGTGNVKALPEPQLPALAGVEVYPPAQDSRLEVSDERVGGIKRFRWVLVPQQPGTVVIPPIEYAYFDPAERKYQVLRTDELHVLTVPLAGASAPDTALRPLRVRERTGSTRWALSRGFLMLQAVPVLALLLIVGVQRRRSAPPSARSIRRRAVDQLTALRHAPRDAAFLTELERTLLRGVCDTLGADQDPAGALRRRGQPAVADRLDRLIGELRRLRYAPAEPYDADALLAEALEIIRAVPTREPREAGDVVRLLLLGTAAAFAAAPPARAQADAWQEAVSAYEAADYVTAANRFHAHARDNPVSADAWYNLGNAAFRAGDPGRAVWAWLRAARLAPRDPDVAHNLRIAGAAGALRQVRPLDRLTQGERAIVAAVAWWLLVLSIGLALAGRRRVLWLGGAAAVVLLLASAATGAERLGRPRVAPLGTGAELRAAPADRAESLGRLDVGDLATVVDSRNGFLRVRLADSREAWVDRRDVAAP